MGGLFRGKVVLVTGAGSGIGKAAALAYAAKGATVVVSDRVVSDTAYLIKSKKGEACFIKADISIADDCKYLVKEIVERYGKLDIAVNCAGMQGEANNLMDMSAEGFNKIISDNLCGIFYSMKYEIRAMLKQGVGIIINTAFILGIEKLVSFSGYDAARHGVIGLTQNAAREYANENIRIHCVAPEYVNSPILETIDVKSKTALSLQHLRGQTGKAEEIAAMVIWLSSDKASSATSSCYPTGSGYLLN